MNLTPTRTGPGALPPLERLVLFAADLPGFHCVYADARDDTNEAVAARMADPEKARRRLESWGRLDGYAVRFVPEGAPCNPTVPIVVDSSAARFARGAGALLALTDESSLLGAAGVVRLFPRNIADNTESVSEVFEEDGKQFTLYRVDFRLSNILGSVGAVWLRPYGTPLEVLRLAQRQAERIRAALSGYGERSLRANALPQRRSAVG